MSNVFTETTSTSWFGRMKKAIFGVFLGILFIPGAMFLLFWNESRAINETHRLNSGEEAVVEDVSIESIDPSLEGELIHVSGLAHAVDPVEDSKFLIARDGLRLKREVEMYQYKEHVETETKKKLGGGEKKTKTYRYTEEWHEGRINSSNFKQENGHINPALPFDSEEDISTEVDLGSFKFPKRLVGSIHNWEDIKLEDAWFESLPEEMKDHSIIAGNKLYYSETNLPEVSKPKIGDIRVSFSWVPDSDITLVSSQHEESFRPYSTDYGDLELLQMGKLSATEVFQRAHSANTMWTWGLRLAGFVIMGIGFCMIMAPLSTFVSFIPFLENIAGFGIAIVGFGLSAVLSSIVIAIAWIAVRPILGISLLVLAGGIVVGLWFLRSTTPKEPDHGVELLS